jgi:hypothetical protein
MTINTLFLLSFMVYADVSIVCNLHRNASLPFEQQFGEQTLTFYA